MANFGTVGVDWQQRVTGTASGSTGSSERVSA